MSWPLGFRDNLKKDGGTCPRIVPLVKVTKSSGKTAFWSEVVHGRSEDCGNEMIIDG